jgi:hypothetical protein
MNREHQQDEQDNDQVQPEPTCDGMADLPTTDEEGE